MKNYLFYFLFLASNLFAQTNVQVIELPGAAFNDVSVDGNYVVGVLNFSQAFVWSEATGIINLTPDNNGEAFGVSNTGRIVGRRPDSNWTTPGGDIVIVAGYWEIDGSWHPIGNFPGIEPFDPLFFGNATCISADGTIIGGYGALPNWHPVAYRWSEADLFFDIKEDNEYQGTRALSLSADAQVLGGWISGPGIFWHPSIWNPDLLELGSFNPDFNDGDVFALNNDGTIAYGKAGGEFYSVAMYWSDSSGLVNLVETNLNYESKAWGGSDDGSIIGGQIGPFGVTLGFIWTPDVGMRFFDEWLSEYGITLGSNWTIRSVSDISADGKVIIAWGDNTDTPGTISDGLVIILDDPVPVELLSFTATVSKDEVQLNWSTASETNNSGFEIQRKINNSDWQKISFIPGFGTTTEQHSYTYSDRTISSGIYNYRLKQIDYDGSFEYSDVVQVDIEQLNEFKLEQNYPNPFNPSTTISFSVPNESHVNLNVYNVIGELVAELVNEVKNAGSYKVQFNADNLVSGMYIVKMQAGNFVSVKKMTLMK